MRIITALVAGLALVVAISGCSRPNGVGGVTYQRERVPVQRQPSIRHRGKDSIQFAAIRNVIVRETPVSVGVADAE